MDGGQVSVVEDNDHLGLTISGSQQTEKNIDAKINKARKSLFSLLGPAFSYKCLLSPTVKLYVYKTYTNPILLSGLSSLAIRKAQMEPLAIFQRKMLKSILHLSITANTPSIHFLTAELPIEAMVHRDMYSLFYSMWSNPDTNIYKIVKYLLETSNENSRTWPIYLRHISKLYQI